MQKEGVLAIMFSNSLTLSRFEKGVTCVQFFVKKTVESTSKVEQLIPFTHLSWSH